MLYVFVVGLLMGLANLIPGVSGGTIALIGGVYEKLISAVASLSSLRFDKRQILLISVLGAGIVVGIVGFSKLMGVALQSFPSLMYGAFSGLVLGSSPIVLRKIRKRSLFSVVAFSLGALIVLVIAFSGVRPENSGVLTHNISSLFYDFVAGFIGAAAMVLPGLSGAFILLIMGEYSRAISAVSERDLIIITFIGFGVLTGIVLISKLMKILLKKYQDQTFSFLLGMMAGSIPDLLTRTGEETRLPLLFTGMAAGIIFSLALLKLERWHKRSSVMVD